MKTITRGLSPKLLAVAPLAQKRVFPAWTTSTYRSAFESRWSYARLASLLEAGSLPVSGK